MAGTPSLGGLDPTRDFVAVDAGGVFKTTGVARSNADDLKKLFAWLNANPPAQLVIHFHGGLDPEADGIRIANSMKQLYANTNARVVSFIWETGVCDAIKQQLSDLNGDEVFKAIRDAVLKHFGKYAIQTAMARGIGTSGWDDQFVASELNKPKPFDSFDRAAQVPDMLSARAPVALDDVLSEDEIIALSAQLQADDRLLDALSGPIPANASPALRTLMESQRTSAGGVRARGLSTMAARFIATVVWNVIRRLVTKHGHGLYCTVVEQVLRAVYLNGVAAFIWDGMKKKASAMFEPNNGVSEADQHAGNCFLSYLGDFAAAHPTVKIDLTAHSAGSIAVCELLAAASQLPKKVVFSEILFMAPACRVDLFDQNIINRGSQYKSFRMFTMTDDLECDDTLVPVIYTKSLLYFVSGVCEADADTEIAGLARHFTGAPPYDSGAPFHLSQFLNVQPDRLAFSKPTPTAAQGMTTAAQHHQDFNTDVPTRNSLKFIVTHG